MHLSIKTLLKINKLLSFSIIPARTLKDLVKFNNKNNDIVKMFLTRFFFEIFMYFHKLPSMIKHHFY